MNREGRGRAGVALVVRYEVREGEADAVARALKEMGQLVRERESRCSLWVASQAHDDRRVFHLYEQYEDEKALEEHRQTEHFQRLIVGDVRPRLANREASTADIVVG